MRILGIDYGRSKIGLAIGEIDFAEPFEVVNVTSFEEAISKIMKVIKEEQIEKVVVGISEGEMGVESENYSKILASKLNIPVTTFDETLTSQDAQALSLEARINRKKRHEMEDAYAATLMLQNFLDENTTHS